jgi:predicted amidophosphoribosyltransferase
MNVVRRNLDISVAIALTKLESLLMVSSRGKSQMSKKQGICKRCGEDRDLDEQDFCSVCSQENTISLTDLFEADSYFGSDMEEDYP